MVGRGGWLPTSLQDGMSSDSNFAKIDSEEFIQASKDEKDYNKNMLFPGGGFGPEPAMHEDSGMHNNHKN